MSTFSIESVCDKLSGHMKCWLDNLIMNNEELIDSVSEALDCVDDTLRLEKKIFIYSFIIETIKQIKHSNVDSVIDEKLVGFIMRNNSDEIDLNAFIKSLQIDEMYVINEQLLLHCSIRATAGGRKRLYFDYTISIKEPENDTGLYNIGVGVKNISRDNA